MDTSPTGQDTTEFAAIVHRLVVRASRQHPRFAVRLERAAALVLSAPQPVVCYPDGTATVLSQRDASRTYRVAGAHCECPDHQYRQRVCVHSLAAGLWQRARRELRAEQHRRQCYGRTYVAPGTPGACCPCGACGITAVLDRFGLCPECAAERFCLTAVGEAVLVAGVA